MAQHTRQHNPNTGGNCHDTHYNQRYGYVRSHRTWCGAACESSRADAKDGYQAGLESTAKAWIRTVAGWNRQSL